MSNGESKGSGGVPWYFWLIVMVIGWFYFAGPALTGKTSDILVHDAMNWVASLDVRILSPESKSNPVVAPQIIVEPKVDVHLDRGDIDQAVQQEIERRMQELEAAQPAQPNFGPTATATPEGTNGMTYVPLRTKGTDGPSLLDWLKENVWERFPGVR